MQSSKTFYGLINTILRSNEYGLKSGRFYGFYGFAILRFFFNINGKHILVPLFLQLPSRIASPAKRGRHRGHGPPAPGEPLRRLLPQSRPKTLAQSLGHKVTQYIYRILKQYIISFFNFRSNVFYHGCF